MYVRLAEGLTKYKLIPENENIWDHITSNNKDYYLSIFKYNQEQYDHWKKTNTVAGIKDVYTSKLLFDFDSKENVEEARQDSIELVTRLLNKGIKSDNIQIAYSGQKGICIEVDTTCKFTPEEFKNITFALASDLESFDRVVNDSQRIVRVVGTKHPKSGLYKFPLTVKQLTELPISEIKALASNIDNIDSDVMNGWEEIKLPETIINLKYREEKKLETNPNLEITEELDLSKKPKWLTEAKYALQMGFFGAGERNTAFMVLAATYKAQGFPKEIAYRMLKGVAEIQSNRNEQEPYSNKELWHNVVEVVYSPNWRGATYSYQNTPLLQDVTKRLNLKVEGSEDNPLVPVDNVTSIFKKFALDIDKNTIKLGIPIVDTEVRVTTSMLVGLLAGPSAGKTTVSLNIINSTSKSGIKTGFFSLDMGAPLVFQRLIQKHTGMSSKRIFELYKNNDPRISEFEKLISDEYKNTKFCFRSGVTVENVKEFVLNENLKDPDNPMKLLVLDYLECLSGPFSDSTANTALVAQQLKDLANDLEMCIILLLQPQKMAGDASAELLSMRNIKGSSVIEQACSIIFTMWRPGFSPKTPEEDKFLSMAVVKNRMGQLTTFDFGFDGLTGNLWELDEIEVGELDELRKRKVAEKAQDI